jgi:hypothetical protein
MIELKGKSRQILAETLSTVTSDKQQLEAVSLHKITSLAQVLGYHIPHA